MSPAVQSPVVRPSRTNQLAQRAAALVGVCGLPASSREGADRRGLQRIEPHARASSAAFLVVLGLDASRQPATRTA